MANETHSPKTPFPLLLGQVADWSGWEYLYEERRKVFAFIILIVAVLLGIGWLVSKKQTSSLGDLLQAEAIVTTITDPSSDVPPETIEKDATKLLSFSQDPTILSRFCGVLAQEDILTKEKDFNKKPFDTTSKQLIEQGCPMLSSLVQASLIQETGSKDEALKKIDDLLVETHLPWFRLYLLIQKAYLLQELGKPNNHVIEELKTCAKGIDEVNDFFEEWLHVSAIDFFESLTRK